MSEQTTHVNVDPSEIDKFSQLAHKWWDEESEFKPLHKINPLRLQYIDGYAQLNGKKVVDVGCGGGILTEALTKSGATTLGVDLAEKSLKIAQLHALETECKMCLTAASAWKIWLPSKLGNTMWSRVWK